MVFPRKSVLITGCSAGGIGAALAEVFHERGYHVFATARTPSKIPPSLSEAKGNVTVLALDVLLPESIAAAVESVRSVTGGRLGVLVNNSGGGFILPGLDTPIDEGKKTFDLNFWAPMAMLQAFAPLLIEAKGCVVNNTSGSAVIPMPLMSIYNASKAALALASETWRRELSPLGVRTITLITLEVKTEFWTGYVRPDIPETSYYAAIRGFIHDRGDGNLNAQGISARQYAVKVVSEIDKGTSGTVWAGKGDFVNRLALWLFPQRIIDMILESIIPVAGAMAKARKGKA